MRELKIPNTFPVLFKTKTVSLENETVLYTLYIYYLFYENLSATFSETPVVE